MKQKIKDELKYSIENEFSQEQLKIIDKFLNQTKQETLKEFSARIDKIKFLSKMQKQLIKLEIKKELENEIENKIL